MDLLDGKYQIEQLLGQGGMGAVYRATHLGTKRTVAVKVIHPELLTNQPLANSNAELSSNNEFVARFRREAEAAGRLRHPNVVDVTDFGFAQTSRGPVAYLVMEYLDGCTLSEVLTEEGALPIGWTIDILEQVCSAVDEAHGAGIIHRDLKPDNIWLEPNRRGGYTVKVLDFGLVKLGEPDHTLARNVSELPATEEETYRRTSGEDNTLRMAAGEAETLLRSASEEHQLRKVSARSETYERINSPVESNGRGSSDPSLKGRTTRPHEENLTRLGSVMGTPFYMSPEQCRGESLTPSSDIYSLGVVAYRILTGETPFKGTNEELIELHQTAEPPPIREKNRKIPRKMARIIMAALAKDPKARPPSAAGFASALRASWEGTGSLLRHAFALYSEHIPTFLQISLLGYAPMILLLLFGAFSDKFIDPSQFSFTQLMVYGVAQLVALMVSLLFAYFFVSAATVPVVVQLMVSPLRTVRIRTAFAALKKRWVIFAVTSLIVMTMILLGTALFVVPGLIAAILYCLYAPVAIMERSGVRDTLRRSRTLTRRALLSVLIITLVEFTLPILVWRAAVTTDFNLKLGNDWWPREFGFNISLSGLSAMYQLVNVLVTPLTAIMISLLYLKTRSAGGESLKDTSEQFEELEILRSKWEAKMRSRSLTS